jgi:IS30 family transposase
MPVFCESCALVFKLNFVPTPLGSSIGGTSELTYKGIELQSHPLFKTAISSSGKEMANHKNFTIATNVQVYFCDPRSPWQRGSNENTNGLLRQYLPKGMDFLGNSQSYLNKIALRSNQRPRNTLGLETPADKLRAVLQWPVESTTQSCRW